MTRVLLFDIDQTLLYTVGAGSLAMNIAFEQMFGISDGFAKVEFSGRSDLFIFNEGLRQHGIEGGYAAYLNEFLRRYYGLLRETIRKRRGYLMPGFPKLLEALSQRQNVRLGLATGNFSEAAQIKLNYYGIGRYFVDGDVYLGGFGEESLERADIVRAAIERVADGVSREDILIIGDTPHDISSALDNGVVAVAVATGSYTVERLRESGAHLAFEDFSDWAKAAATLSGLA